METVATFNQAARVFTPDKSGNPVLISLMPEIGKLRLTNRLIGAINAAFPRLNARAYQALRALLSHCGYHSNRVWASLKRLGKLIVGEKSKAKDQGYKLAERGIGDLVEAGLIRVIDDEKELRNGPGEHDFLAAGCTKQGDGAVNHYDLSPLLPFIDEDDRKEWEILMKRKAERLSPEPPADLAEVWSGQAEFPPTRMPQPEEEFEDPFVSEEELAEKAERLAARQAITDVVNAFPNISADPPSVSVSSPACTSGLSMESAHHIEPCYVTQSPVINKKEQANGAQPNAVGSRFFSQTDVSGKPKSDTHTRENTREASAQTGQQTDTGTVFGLLTRTRANGGFGLDKPGAQRLVNDHSDILIRDVLEYITALEAQGTALYGPGRVTKTINAIASGSEFPQWYKEMREKRRRQADRDRRRAEREMAQVAQNTLGGVAEPLRGIWEQLTQDLRQEPGIREPYWQMHIRKLDTATLSGDSVTITALTKPGYEQLTLTHKATFARVLGKLLGRTVRVTFTAPKPKDDQN